MTNDRKLDVDPSGGFVPSIVAVALLDEIVKSSSRGNYLFIIATRCMFDY
jgi:hypothetical protein